MREALELALKGIGKTSPNPAVGCVIVKNGKIIGRGYHKKAGKPHAEINAMRDAKRNKKDVRGATMYVTLEPCCFYGRTPPCTKAIINAGIQRVVAAMKDPNPKVAGKGFKELRKASIEVKSGVLEEDAKEINEAYIKFMTTGLPFVIAKAALSADGKMAAKRGALKWITGEKARLEGRKLRALVDAVIVGANTVVKDNPRLTCRVKGCRNPKRVIVDARLIINEKSKVFNKEAETIVATTSKAPKKKIAALKKRGANVLVIGNGDRVDLKKLLKELASMEVTSIMIEGGGKLLGSAFDAGIVDKVIFFITPKIIGPGISIESKAFKTIDDAFRLKDIEMMPIGEDLMIVGYPRK